MQSSEKDAQKLPFRWELLFFVSFAVVITLAVNVAGVLMVFAFLILPAFSASLVAGTFGQRLLLGWGLAVIGSLVGLWLSFVGDLPTGAIVVTVLGMSPIVAGMVRVICYKKRTVSGSS